MNYWDACQAYSKVKSLQINLENLYIFDSMTSILNISLEFFIIDKIQQSISSPVYSYHLQCHEEVPAKSLGHTCIFDIWIRSKAPDENCNHLKRNMLHKACQCYGRFK